MAARITKATRPRTSKQQGPANEPIETAHVVVPCSPSPDEIRMLAYQKWMAAGQPTGDGVEFWLNAEQELTRQSSEAAGKPVSESRQFAS